MDIKLKVWNGDNIVSLSKALHEGIVCVQHNREDCFGIEPVFEGVEIMQFTGIKDKNGVDIYEGFLIKNQRGRTAEVAWHKFTASFDSIFVSDDDSAPIALDKSYGFHNADWKHEVEVIGNIYQNPELIENNNK